MVKKKVKRRRAVACPAAAPRREASPPPRAGGPTVVTPGDPTRLPAGGAPVTCGSHCSGWGVEGLALEKLAVPHVHLFACDINHEVRTLLRDNFAIPLIMQDLRDPDTLSESPHVDVYVCGFPCQPFSKEGKNDGMADPRANVLVNLLRYLQEKPPVVFCLENVVGFASGQHRPSFHLFLKHIREMKDATNAPLYMLGWKILDSADFGLAQRRRRVYVVGLRADRYGPKHGHPPFSWPSPVACPGLQTFFDTPETFAASGTPCKLTTTGAQRNLGKAFAKLLAKGLDPLTTTAVVDLGMGPKRANFAVDRSPTLTASRCASPGSYYVTSLRRPLSVSELARLQGIELTRFNKPLAPRHMGQVIGNAMSVTVTAAIFKQALPAVGLTKPWVGV